MKNRGVDKERGEGKRMRAEERGRSVETGGGREQG